MLVTVLSQESGVFLNTLALDRDLSFVNHAWQ